MESNEILHPNSIINVSQLSRFKDKLLAVTQNQFTIRKTTQGLASNLAAKYELVNSGGSTMGSAIEIYKDQFLQHAALYLSSAQAILDGLIPPPGLEFPALYLVFNITPVESGDPGKLPIWISVKSLVDVYTAGNGINITGNEVSIKLLSQNSGLAVTSNGLGVGIVADSGLIFDNNKLSLALDGNTMEVTDDGYIRVAASANLSGNQLATASSNVKGAIKVGSGLTISTDGTLSATGTDITVDATLSTTSTNPAQNKVITTAINNCIHYESDGSVEIDGDVNIDGELWVSDNIGVWDEKLTIRVSEGSATQTYTFKEYAESVSGNISSINTSITNLGSAIDTINSNISNIEDDIDALESKVVFATNADIDSLFS